jgi:hypothetical protein
VNGRAILDVIPGRGEASNLESRDVQREIPGLVLRTIPE